MIKKYSCGLKVKHIACLMICIFALSGCGDAASSIDPADVAQKLEESGVAEEVNSIPELVTEDDFRSAIKALTSSAEDIASKVEIYDAFAGKFELSEAEYIEYAQACADIGDTKKQREVLWMLYRLYPTEEYGNLISDSVLVLDKAVDTDAYDIAGQMASALETIGTDQFDISAAMNIMLQESWINNFFLDAGIYTSHSRCNGDGYIADIYADQVTNTAIVVKDNIAYGISKNAIGCDVWKCGVSDTGYEGEYYVANYDELDNMISSSIGTIKDDHCIGEATFAVGDTVYKGTFDENGLTQESQQDNVEGVIYAYDDSENNYLYVAGGEDTSWTADIEFLGMSEYEK